MPIPSIDQITPASGRLLREDDTTVNIGDLAGGNDVVFHNVVSQTGDGTPLSVGGYKTVTVELYGTSSSRTVNFMGKSKSGTLRAIMGINMGTFANATQTTGNNEIWQFDVTGLDMFYIQLSAVSGGSFSAKGRAVG